MKVTIVEALGFLAMVAIVVCAVRDCDDKHRCTRNGGRVEEYNCVPVFCGDGCYVESCDWRTAGRHTSNTDRPS